MEGNPWGGNMIAGEKGEGAAGASEFAEGAAAPEGSSADPNYMYNSHGNGSSNAENY